MKKSMFITRFFVIGLALSMLFLSPFILDYTLTPRYIALAAARLTTLFLVTRSGLAAEFKLDIFNAAYIFYSVLCLASVGWTINQPEAFFDSSKTILVLAVFLMTRFFLGLERAYLMDSLMKISILIFFVLFAVFIYQLTALTIFDKEALYTISGLNGHKNLFRSFLFINLFFLVAGYFKLPERWKLFSWMAIILSLLLLFFLKTKAVWMAAVVSVAVFTVVYHTSGKVKASRISPTLKMFVLLIVTNLFFLFVLPHIIKAALNYNLKFQDKGLSLDQERLVIWDKTYHMIQTHPFGVGSGNWQTYFPQATLTGLWRAEDLNYTFQRPHNDFLWILSETGWLGLNVFLIFIFSLLVGLRTAIGAISEKSSRMDMSLCMAAICGYLTISFFDFPKERIEHGILMSVIFAISANHIQRNITLKTWGLIPVRKIMLYIFSILFFGLFLLGVLRCKGEFYTRKMYDAKLNKQHVLLVNAGNLALSPVYNIDPTSMPISWYMGNAETLVPNQQQKALEYFKEAYRLAPFNRNVINDLASGYATVGNLVLAKKYYKEAVLISPRFDEPKLNLVAIYINEKNFKMASECIKTLYHDSERRGQYQKIIDVFGIK